MSYRISICRYGNGQQQVKSYPVEFFNHIELSGIPSDKLRLKFGVPDLFIRNLDVPRLRNGTRFQITHLGPKVVLATDMTGIARVLNSMHSDNTEGYFHPSSKGNNSF
ncbi:hypothetical protein AVEN_139814-1 [Araneus ventricosus]|uniref:DNA helicase Pif1-like 2B domain-containing protein n=1 Tax=Araneus ventricosus TaxID=182803 RepID=A0A4Y2VC68_ARAVE|nr:hypothetical protein AVEN_139814-1 [Araneus ventricosus]